MVTLTHKPSVKLSRGKPSRKPAATAVRRTFCKIHLLGTCTGHTNEAGPNITTGHAKGRGGIGGVQARVEGAGAKLASPSVGS